MPKGHKAALTLDEQLIKITSEIENMGNSLRKLKNAKKNLEEQTHQARLSELDELLQKRGISLDELKEMLDESNEE